MGCCFSKAEDPSRGEAASTVCRRRIPPPPEAEALQEETVKEVLSETPKPKARPEEEGIEEEEVGFDKVLKGGPGVNGIKGRYDERSEENSEVCSMSEGFSASTMATDGRVGEKGDAEEVESEARRATEERPSAKFQGKRSVSGEIPRNIERGAGGGSGRSSPSPVKRREAAVGRTYSAREMGQGKAARSRVPAGDAFRRDPGERSGRRSVSPAAKRAAEIRSATTGGQCRVVPASRENGRSSLLRTPPAASASAEEASRGEGKESLENPLVSLECFIFL